MPAAGSYPTMPICVATAEGGGQLHVVQKINQIESGATCNGGIGISPDPRRQGEQPREHHRTRRLSSSSSSGQGWSVPEQRCRGSPHQPVSSSGTVGRPEQYRRCRGRDSCRAPSPRRGVPDCKDMAQCGISRSYAVPPIRAVTSARGHSVGLAAGSRPRETQRRSRWPVEAIAGQGTPRRQPGTAVLLY